MVKIRIELLGPPQITRDGDAIQTDRRKAIGLLAYLATDAGPHQREALAALFWPDYPQASAFSYLRRTLWELNQILGKGVILSDREQIELLSLPNVEIDIQIFHRLSAQGGNQSDALVEAASLYRGDFMEGFVIADTASFEDWQVERAEYFRREYAGVLERLIDAFENNRMYERALPYTQRWLALDRLNEAGYRAVMRLLTGMGDRSGAIRVYQTCVQTLHDELGVSPQRETEETYQAILHGDKAGKLGEEHEKIPAQIPTSAPGNVPSPPTPFIGRQEEIDQVHQMVLDPHIRLLTVTGPGGTGKTRLSIQVASQMDGQFPDGTWFIPLAPVQSTQSIIMTIAKNLNHPFFTGGESARQQLLDYLRSKCMLIVLDNFEHLLDKGRELLVDILENSHDVKLLVTSRTRLNLRAEQVFVLQGLRIPDEQAMVGMDYSEARVEEYSAIQLLLERARRVNQEFSLTRENITAALHICQLLEGSPLGIELSAAWLEIMPVEEIDKEISRSLDFLESISADVPDRQRSLRAVFETSWKLLDAHEQQCFLRLCKFQGSFSRQAAQQVSNASIQTLLGLVNKSWLQQTDNGRYQIHEVLRQYGVELLQADQQEWQETNERHAEFFTTLIQEYGQELQTANQLHALQQIQLELDSNFPAAAEWQAWMGRFDELIEKILPGLFHYWLIRTGSEDFINLIKRARKAVPSSKERKVVLQQVILETAETNLELSWAILDDQPKQRIHQLWKRVHEEALENEMGFWYRVLAVTYGGFVDFKQGVKRFRYILENINAIQSPWDLGYTYLFVSQFCDSENPASQKEHLSKALEIFKKIGVIDEQGITYRLLGQLYSSERDYSKAISCTQAAAQYLEQVGDLWGVNQAWMSLADYFIFSGDIEQAFHAYDIIRKFSENAGNRRILGISLSWESLAVSRYGDLNRALELRKRSQEIAVEIGNQSDIAWHTWELGEVYRLLADIDRAKQYYQEAYPVFEKLQDYLGCGYFHRGMGDIAIMMGDWEAAKSEFLQALGFQEREQRNLTTWALIYYHSKLGYCLAKSGAYNEAKMQLREAISLTETWHWPDIISLPMLGMAALLAETGSPAEAIEIASCIASKRTTWNEVKKQAQLVASEASHSIPEEQTVQAKERGESLDIHQLVRSYLDSPHLTILSVEG